MKRRKFIIYLCLFFASFSSNGQTIAELSIKICDSIKSHNYTKSDTIALKQAEIYSNFIGQYYLNNTQRQLINWQSDFNSLNYKLTRELNKNCDSFKIQNSFILPFSNLIEIDSIFSEQQSQKINEIAKDIRIKNRILISKKIYNSDKSYISKAEYKNEKHFIREIENVLNNYITD